MFSLTFSQVVHCSGNGILPHSALTLDLAGKQILTQSSMKSLHVSSHPRPINYVYIDTLDLAASSNKVSEHFGHVNSCYRLRFLFENTQAYLENFTKHFLENTKKIFPNILCFGIYLVFVFGNLKNQ